MSAKKSKAQVKPKAGRPQAKKSKPAQAKAARPAPGKTKLASVKATAKPPAAKPGAQPPPPPTGGKQTGGKQIGPLPLPSPLPLPLKPGASKPGASKPSKAGMVAPIPGRPGAGRPVGAAPGLRPPSKKSSRRSPLLQRRGPDGQLLQPGDLLLPGGVQTLEEIQYLFRGVIATQRQVGDLPFTEVSAKRPAGDSLTTRSDLDRHYAALTARFNGGTIEPALPNRPQPKRTFLGVIERAKQRRREIGSFLRGLDLGRPESSQMDSHGEASLQSLMEWSARLEKLMDTDEPAQADYTVFHRAMDQLDHTTEALIVDVEATLRRLGARSR